LSNRNLIINGAMQVAQRGTSSTASGINTVDRFKCVSGVPTITQSQNSLTSSDTPYARGFRSSYRATVTTASNSATSFVQIEQNIEAQNVAQSGWDYTDPSSYVTLSFWAKSSLAGTYYSQFRTTDTTAYYYSKSFTLSADTWTQVTCTVSGNANLVIDNDNGLGLTVLVIPDFGTDYSGHAEAVEDAWYARTQVSGYTPTFAQDWRNTAGATFDVTGVQLEVGDTATPFEHRSYGDELQRCQRFFYRLGNIQSYSNIANVAAIDGSTYCANIPLPVPFRASPSVSTSGGSVFSNESADFVPAFSVPSNTVKDGHLSLFFPTKGTPPTYAVMRGGRSGSISHIDFDADL
jgi:hypothetical protein